MCSDQCTGTNNNRARKVTALLLYCSTTLLFAADRIVFRRLWNDLDIPSCWFTWPPIGPGCCGMLVPHRNSCQPVKMASFPSSTKHWWHIAFTDTFCLGSVALLNFPGNAPCVAFPFLLVCLFQCSINKLLFAPLLKSVDSLLHCPWNAVIMFCRYISLTLLLTLSALVPCDYGQLTHTSSQAPVFSFEDLLRLQKSFWDNFLYPADAKQVCIMLLDQVHREAWGINNFPLSNRQNPSIQLSSPKMSSGVLISREHSMAVSWTPSTSSGCSQI